jgi:hypothetical protein
LVALALKLASRYTALADVRGGLSATVGLLFDVSERPPLRESVAVTFARTLHAGARHSRAGRARVRRKGRGGGG